MVHIFYPAFKNVIPQTTFAWGSLLVNARVWGPQSIKSLMLWFIVSKKKKVTNLLSWYINKLDIHGSVHRRWFSRNTNKMQLCSRIYYSKVYWKLNMFRGAHRSSSGALNCICSLWFIYCYKVKDFVHIIHSPYYNITIIFSVTILTIHFNQS